MTTHRPSRRAEDGPTAPTWCSTARLLYADRVPRTYGPRQRPRHRKQHRPAFRRSGHLDGAILVAIVVVALLWATVMLALVAGA
ncbi:hypothetical protein [Corynebacterium freneyi]|uniref:hypothetical protein n=1 Tax=Corynebacterium freneyi TaxID=134034 RepID=UPI001CCFDCD1|nr:hypothetical protein [Corynebacterium freneyi]UBI01586.1 hypothetical protein LA334_08620 [Corynebacterium freneyi]